MSEMIGKKITKFASSILALGLLGACGAQQDGGAAQSSTATAIHPENWAKQETTIAADESTEQRIINLLGRMTLEEKVGQIIQADVDSVTPEQVRQYNLGAVLNGGNSAPGGDNYAAPGEWLALADEFWDASTDTSDGGVGIPTIWGTDAVHGHNNIPGATIFPHNIGLGMANDPDMIFDIGRATALEMRATGLDWTFAPTIAVARNDRWGRTYESYSEDPRIVAAYAPRMVEGIQGRLGTDEFLDEDRMIATAKHYVGDGGTTNGTDQGDTVISEQSFRDNHAAGYPPAIAAGVQSVMASFNSYHGRKMHGHKEMLTDVLVGRMGFDGFVVGDWNGHGQVAGCTNTSCAASFNAGVDLFMAPDSWKGLYRSTLQQVKNGEISMQRLDEAVARVLRVKFRAGIFESGRPSSRRHAGDYSLLGSQQHRAVARKAVRKSLVLLKNSDELLPLNPALSVLLAGDGADNIGKQSGGWTLNWQGTDNLNEHFPNGVSIYDGLKDAFEAGGGQVTLSEDGSYDVDPDVAIVVFGEDPYAEHQGDRASVDYDSDDGLMLLRKFRAAGIPAVAVFISGRPMWVNPEINASDAFVAAWLPGTEGAGIADVLVGDADGAPRHDFEGRLSFSWPKAADQVDVNVGDADYDPQFAYGFGLSYADDGDLPRLAEEGGIVDSGELANLDLIKYGDPVGQWGMTLRDVYGNQRVSSSRGTSAGGLLDAEPADHRAQEDTVLLTWRGKASLIIEGRPVDLMREAGDNFAFELIYQVINASVDSASLEIGHGEMRRVEFDVSDELQQQAGRGWRTALIKFSCFEGREINMESIAEPLVISANGELALQLSSARIVTDPGTATCSI